LNEKLEFEHINREHMIEVRSLVKFCYNINKVREYFTRKKNIYEYFTHKS